MAARVLVAVAVAAIAAIIAGYLLLIHSQGGGDPDMPLVVPFVTAYLVLMAILLAASLFVPPAAPALRAAASAGLVVLGVLAAFSIGVAVLIAAGLAIAATVIAFRERHSTRSVMSAVTAAVSSVLLLFFGFQLAWSYIVCPPGGESSGTTAGFFGSSSYVCSGGVLVVGTR